MRLTLKSSKPFSTISYNTDTFLFTKLTDLVNKNKIDFFVFINHLPEEDESKSHKHLFIVPNGQVDTDQVRDYLEELDPNNIDKPLRCLPFQSSKFSDWYFYALHNAEYLASKGQTRKYCYNESEFSCSSSDYLAELRHQIDFNKIGSQKTKLVLERLAGGETPIDLLSVGLISAQNFMQWEKIYNSMFGTNRNGGKTHSPFVSDNYDSDLEEIPKKDEFPL